jgi:hypothetical protein
MRVTIGARIRHISIEYEYEVPDLVWQWNLSTSHVGGCRACIGSGSSV